MSTERARGGGPGRWLAENAQQLAALDITHLSGSVLENLALGTGWVTALKRLCNWNTLQKTPDNGLQMFYLCLIINTFIYILLFFFQEIEILKINLEKSLWDSKTDFITP